MLHHFINPIVRCSLPEKFTYPFHYTPHPLCVAASKEVQTYIQTQEQWKEELEQGKMFGVLIVETKEKEIGYLASFSGILAGKNRHTYFVPPVYDLLQPDGFFKIEEETISTLNREIKQLQEDESFLALKKELAEENDSYQKRLFQAKTHLKTAKEERERRRMNHPNEDELAAMIKESQFQKAEYKRMERIGKEKISFLHSKVADRENQIELLKTERKTRSSALQQKLFEQFDMLNYLGERRNLCNIFRHTTQQMPPAGAGECAAPKLLQYAYLHEMKPIAMAEFWWGHSPKTEIRYHGYYYPACKGKCEPILKHMLKGLEVEENPLNSCSHHKKEPEIIFEDEWLLVINKPAGMLSVPGKEDSDSVYRQIRNKYPEATGPLIVHRLDMATSGLLIIAKTKKVHQHLQAQFKNRTIKKRYIALLEGKVKNATGTINLPICPNPLDRPRQMVCTENGKPAITQYHVLDYNNDQTRIAFYPLTGRTHQLRVHAAHTLGLHCPILGDELYGKSSKRLYLHAEFIQFMHPIHSTIIQCEKVADF